MAKIKTDMQGSVEDSFQSPGPQSAISQVPRSSRHVGRKMMENGAVINIDRIVADGDQPRDEFDEVQLHSLAESLRERGQIQPIKVRWVEELDKYMIVVGERRWRAARIAGLETIACTVMEGTVTADQILEEQLIENCLRVDLTPTAQGRAFKSVMDRKGIGVRALGLLIHVPASTITRTVALLDLPEAIQDKVDKGTIAKDKGYELSKVRDPVEQAELAGRAAYGTLSRDELKARTKVQDRKPIPTGSRDRLTWSYVSGRVRVTITPLADGVTDAERLAAIEGAMEQLRQREGERAA